MAIRPGIAVEFLPRAILVRVAAGFLALLMAALPAEAALLPPGFFDMQVNPGQGPAAVEADRLSYDGVSDLISAEGDVTLSYQGYTIRADRLTYNQRTGELHAENGVLEPSPPSAQMEPYGDSASVQTRCPGGATQPAPDGSNPFTDPDNPPEWGGPVNCDPSIIPTGN